MLQPCDPGAGSAQPVGRGDRIIRQGECVFSIADQTGHYWGAIWNHPANRELKALRGSPHVLLPGDQLHVPERQPGAYYAATDRTHTFIRKGIPIHFAVKVLRDGEPRDGVRYTLEIEGRAESGTLAADGIIHTQIRPSDRRGRLTVGEGEDEEQYHLAFGELDPAHSKLGAAARLRNLGYLGADDSDESFNEALVRFQLDEELAAGTGLNHVSACRLTEVHGS